LVAGLRFDVILLLVREPNLTQLITTFTALSGNS
jgi:hypothetical protein